MVSRSSLWVGVWAAVFVGCTAHEEQPAQIAQVDSAPPVGIETRVCPADSGDVMTVSGVDAPREWQAFRRAHPYHVQETAVGRPGGDGSRLLVIAEPPPDVCLDDIRQLSPEFATVTTYRWRIGTDGWVRDAVVRLPAMTADNLDWLLLAVQRLVRGTTYESRVTSLETPELRSNASLDMSVTATELKQWLLAGSETFASSGVGPGVSLGELLSQESYGEYLSVNPGFVLWVIPLHRDIRPFLDAARAWVVDADLILGGIADSATVAVVGRERRVGLQDLAPLRVETIHTLANTGTDHLAQSYERTYPLAGRMSSLYDWAPAYLSPILIDDEYGSLLGITDQILKSWSEHGTVHYVNFPYPRPSRYPFPTTLHERLHSSQVTFNWNTKGAGYVVDAEGVRIYALNRTGALPVSYFAGTDEERNERTLAAETTAYDYFASLNDPNLARVVQYAALYQMFRAFGVGMAQPVPPPTPPPPGLDSIAVDVLNALAGWSDEYLAGFSARVREEVRPARDLVHAIQEIGGDGAVAAVAARLVRGRGDSAAWPADSAFIANAYVDGRLRDGLSTADTVRLLSIRAAKSLPPIFDVLLDGNERQNARDVFLGAADRPANRWIRTSSIVQSWSTGSSADWVGGHNLDAAVTRFRVSDAVAPGEVRVITEGEHKVILANEADVDRLSGNVREIVSAAEADDGGAGLRALVGRLQERPVRPREVVIPVADRVPEPPPAVLGRGMIGYQRVSRTLSQQEQAVADFLRSRTLPYMAVSRLPEGGFEIVLDGPNRVLRASNTASAVDVLTAAARRPGATPLRQLQLSGFSEEDATAFTQDVEWQLRQTGTTDEDVTSVVHDGVDDELGTLRAVAQEADFSRARVHDIRAVEVDVNGRKVPAYEVNVELPTRTQSVWMRILIFFKEGVVQPALETIRTAVEQAMAKVGTYASVDLAAKVLKAELKRYGVEPQFRMAGDVLIVQRPQSSRGSDETG